ncbi:MAG: hypothetical protein ABIZ50_03690, partial [Solirubrobacterales bacterium]
MRSSYLNGRVRPRAPIRNWVRHSVFPAGQIEPVPIVLARRVRATRLADHQPSDDLAAVRVGDRD